MKRYLLLIAVWLAALTASADPIITGGIYSYPANQSVYVSDYYGADISVNYNSPIASTTPVVATLKRIADGTVITSVTVTPNIGDYGLVFPVASALDNAGFTSGAFSLSVPAVTLGDIEVTWDEQWNPVYNIISTASSDAFTGSFLLKSAMPICTLTPSVDSILTTKAFTATYTFSEAVSCDSVQFTGSSSDYTVDLVESTKAVTASATTSFTVPVVAGDWCVTESLPLYLSLNTVGLNISGYSLPAVYSTYQYGETPVVPFQFLGVSPTAMEATYPEILTDYWYVSFKYTQAPELPMTSPVTVVFYDEAGDLLSSINVSLDDVYVDYNYWEGNYVVQVVAPAVPSDATDYETVSVELHGLTYDGSLVPSQTITYTRNVFNAYKNIKKANTTSIKNIVKSDKATHTIYSISGKIVDGNISSLNKGVYVVSGKKIIVK